MTDFILQLNCSFTDADKESCIPVINRLLKLIEIARRRGLLALEAEIETENNLFLKTAVNLTIDANDPDFVKRILQNIILADGYKGAELLEKLLIIEGVLSITEGKNPNLVRLMLNSMLGEKYITDSRSNPQISEVRKPENSPHSVRAAISHYIETE